MNWNGPDLPGGSPLGDGRFALATDRPETIEALREAVSQRVAEGYALYPQGGGTALDYGGIPRRPGVAIQTRSLARVIDYPAADMTITVEAGMTLTELRQVLAEANQRLPLDAPQPDRATLGGIFATNTSGPRRYGAGRPRDMIIGVGFVTADGALVKGGGRVVKNVAGYDLPKLLTGSLGTLGILAQMTLKVRPRPEASALVLVPFDDASALDEALTGLNTSGTRPMALDVLNESALPWLGTVSGPELPRAAWLLAIGYEDNAAAVAWQVDRVLEELRPSREAVILRDDQAEPCWTGLAELQDRGSGRLSFVASLRPSMVVSFLRGLDSAHWAIQAHAGNGIIRGFASEEIPDEVLIATIDRLRAEAVRQAGNLTLPRCPTAWKERLQVWGAPRPDWALCEKVKQALDPQGVMNPGRFVGTI
ncbi:MAG: FAD-binding oxidoreductase [Isosphaeraceae bacterium]|nr:FAD-binding oxidoreductase [Isosphaeraceae bacterium]